jgi:hypothetical protein
MEEPFVIEVNYKGVERAFEARLQVFGYSHRFHVDVEGVEVLFERDEEGSYRAMAPQLPENAPEGMERGTAGLGRVPEAGLLQAIAEAIERILA